MNYTFMLRNASSVSMAAVTTTKNDKTVILDPGSTISNFMALSLLKNVFEVAHPIKVNGFQQSEDSSLNVHEQATFKDFGKVWYSAKSGANILSMSALVDAGAIVEYHSVPEDFFTVRPHGSENQYKFSRCFDEQNGICKGLYSQG